MTNIKQRVLDEYKNGNIVVYNFEGLKIIELSEFIKQPVEGMLYDLNRSESVVLALIEDPKWINDYACAKVIMALNDKIKELSKN